MKSALRQSIPADGISGLGMLYALQHDKFSITLGREATFASSLPRLLCEPQVAYDEGLPWTAPVATLVESVSGGRPALLAADHGVLVHWLEFAKGCGFAINEIDESGALRGRSVHRWNAGGWWVVTYQVSGSRAL